ncbi:hypothetical protein R3P38DRAFT_2768957 [Favolaschia claudopus]|uniref:Uncharacterized protein n=1 Tax=Favolaschia claudopus TaxID=2862362 RepID=A0AAW0CND0_9AGAR
MDAIWHSTELLDESGFPRISAGYALFSLITVDYFIPNKHQDQWSNSPQESFDNGTINRAPFLSAVIDIMEIVYFPGFQPSKAGTGSAWVHTRILSKFGELLDNETSNGAPFLSAVIIEAGKSTALLQTFNQAKQALEVHGCTLSSKRAKLCIPPSPGYCFFVSLHNLEILLESLRAERSGTPESSNACSRSMNKGANEPQRDRAKSRKEKLDSICPSDVKHRRLLTCPTDCLFGAVHSEPSFGEQTMGDLDIEGNINSTSTPTNVIARSPILLPRRRLLTWGEPGILRDSTRSPVFRSTDVAIAFNMDVNNT